MKQTYSSVADEQLLEEVAEEDTMPEAKESSKTYAVEEIVGERGRSRATKHFLVKYEGYEDATHLAKTGFQWTIPKYTCRALDL